MSRQYEAKIGELCRDGRAIYYTFIDGEMVESTCRDSLCRRLNRRAAERRFGQH